MKEILDMLEDYAINFQEEASTKWSSDEEKEVAFIKLSLINELMERIK